jgi:hypothetical protein
MPTDPLIVFLAVKSSDWIFGYPTEVAWIRPIDGATHTALVRTEPEWLKIPTWHFNEFPRADMTRDEFMAQGRPKDEVAADLMRDLAGHQVYGRVIFQRWLNMLTKPNLILLNDVDRLIYDTAVRQGWQGREGVKRFQLAAREARLASNLDRDKALDDARELLIYYKLARGGS